MWSYHQRVASIGFFGGFIWSMVGYALFYLNFTSVGPALALDPWALPDWKKTYIGHLVGIIFLSILSIGVAFLYRYTLQKLSSIWPGVIFGVVLWGIVFYFFHPIFPSLKPVTELDADTIITTLSLYILYGVFIGYSISFEYEEMERSQS
ncbi:YqhR family membrane protein [Aliibacillus thermotolerans]|uniref:YqhR family membrane protein n=1 Tax=Aliibacillus thermotolerans TaxID=1834418 RepID=A0ABW0UAA6_9BACI|nr:YqhR family membrane protein [Aliibacillus thermotolerans]MDA3131123.1 hypothetical protein [Aliibacillus thermotolerans]